MNTVNIFSETLPNGATVIQRLNTVVLCIWDGEYVTWETDSEGVAFWGHYYADDFIGAYADYLKRCNY